MVVLGGGAVYYERGTPVPRNAFESETSRSEIPIFELALIQEKR
jgi:hypothetical protein